MISPTQIIAEWTGGVAAASLLNRYLIQPYLPKVARLLSAIISIPSGHLANFLEDAAVLWNDITNGTGELNIKGAAGELHIKTTPPPALDNSKPTPLTAAQVDRTIKGPTGPTGHAQGTTT